MIKVTPPLIILGVRKIDVGPFSELPYAFFCYDMHTKCLKISWAASEEFSNKHCDTRFLYIRYTYNTICDILFNVKNQGLMKFIKNLS